MKKYSVCEYSSPEVKQGAWEFIKTLVSLIDSAKKINNYESKIPPSLWNGGRIQQGSGFNK